MELRDNTGKMNASSVRNVAILTGGGDRPYALGLAASLIDAGIAFDFIGSNYLQSPIFDESPLVEFLNLRGDQSDDAPPLKKISRVLTYYGRLLRYAITARPKIFHILWNNKFEWFDRTALMVFYKVCGRRLVLTLHNVNAGKRDGNDSYLNRMTLSFQYRLADHIFVHTQQMLSHLQGEFRIPASKVSVIPFGINSTVPDTALDRVAARSRLGLAPDAQVLLFFGNVAPYKGLEYLVEALGRLRATGSTYQLLIAGRLKAPDAYWGSIRDRITELNLESQVIRRIEYIPDEETEVYFKAADVLVLPYRYIFQSGVLFLGYNFGLPVIASDVGSLREDVVEGTTGFLCRSEDPESLAATIRQYFASELYGNLPSRRAEIRAYATERYSWSRVASITTGVYRRLLDTEEVVTR